MNTRLQTSAKNTAPPISTHASGMAVQRKCACGGSAGLLHECESCGRDKLMQRHSSDRASATDQSILMEEFISPGRLGGRSHALTDPHYGHLFSRVAIFPNHEIRASLKEEDLEGQSEAGEEGDVVTDNGTQAVGADTGAVPTGDTTLPGVKTGETRCDAATGTAIAESLNTNPCTSDCSQKHEDKHAVDIGSCCSKAGVASKAVTTEADKTAVQDKFDNWMISNKQWLECRAYPVSVSCGQAKKTKEGCEHSARPACCKTLSNYINSAMRQKEIACNLADKKLSDCPFT